MPASATRFTVCVSGWASMTKPGTHTAMATSTRPRRGVASATDTGSVTRFMVGCSAAVAMSTYARP